MNDFKMTFCLPVVERSVLSLVMKDLDAYFDVYSKAVPTDFLNESHELLFNILISLQKKGLSSFDLGAIVDEAKRLEFYDSIGGIDYIRAILKMDVSFNNLNKYVEQLLNASTKYNLHKTLRYHSEDLAIRASDNGVDADSFLSAVENDVLSISTASKAVEEPKRLGDGLREYVKECLENKIEVSGISTGFPILDKRIDGLIPGTVLVVAARKKAGKSAFISTIARNVGIQLNKPSLYIDTELTFNEWRTRILASVASVEERSIKHGTLNAEELVRVEKALDIIEEARIFHHYMPGYTVDKLTALVTKYKLKEDIGLCVFDYIKAPDSASIERQMKEHQILGDVTTRLKDLAGKLNIPVVTAVQLNRSGDVADSDRIARYADIVAFWAPRDPKNEDDGFEACPIGSHKLYIKDTRRGGGTPPGGIIYAFKKRMLGIRELPPHQQLYDFENYSIDDSEGMINDDEDRPLL